MSQISVNCQNCGALEDISSRARQFICEFCGCQHVLHGRQFIQDTDELQSMLHATTSNLNRTREVRLIRQIRDLDSSWVARWPRKWDLSHNAAQPAASPRQTTVGRLLNKPYYKSQGSGKSHVRIKVPSPFHARFVAWSFLVVGCAGITGAVLLLAPEELLRIPMFLGGLIFLGMTFLLFVYAKQIRLYHALRGDYVNERKLLVGRLQEVRKRDGEQRR
ncbi:MAG: hypothetical protein H7Z17_04995 [Fuerstia sp.]|nr:hypothetical protein [Fuerstiella sp.]